jgi:hypothetical protein
MSSFSHTSEESKMGAIGSPNLKLANSLELSPPREAASFRATQEIPRVLWKLKIHYQV